MIRIMLQYTEHHNRDVSPGKEKNVKGYSETPKKVFICSPLRPRGETEEEQQSDLHKNQQLARFACRYATEHGYMPMAPHLYFTQFMDDADPQDREDGIHYGEMAGGLR